MKQQERTRRIQLALLGSVLFALGMTVAAALDLQINQWLYDPYNPIAIAFECFGYYPLYALPLVWVLLMARDGSSSRSRRILAGVIAVLGAVALVAYSTIGLMNRHVELAVVFCGGVWIILLTSLVKLLRAEPETQRGVRFALGCGVLYAAANTVLVNLLKEIWQRTRFDDLLEAGRLDAFTPWYQFPGGGGSSFPSGHTAAACGLFMLVMLCDVLPAWRKRRALVWAGCWAYIAAMAVCRVVIGRHYVSDTLAAAFVMTVLFLCVTRTGMYRRGVDTFCARESAAQRRAAEKDEAQDAPETADDRA